MVALSAEIRSIGSEGELEQGEIFLLKALAASGASPTVLLGQYGAVAILDELGNVPPAGFLASGVTYFAAYDGANVIIRGATDPAPIAVAATSDGLTTGIIPAGAKFVAFSSASSANFCQLPSAVVGMRIRGWVGANGFKLSSLSASGATINNVAAGLGVASAVIPAQRQLEVQCVLANTWLLTTLTNLGAVGTAIVPS